MAQKKATDLYNETLARLAVNDTQDIEAAKRSLHAVEHAIDMLVGTVKFFEHCPSFTRNNSKLETPFKLGIAFAALHGQKAPRMSRFPSYQNGFNQPAAREFEKFAQLLIEPNYLSIRSEWLSDPSGDAELLHDTDDMIMVRAGWISDLISESGARKLGGSQLAAAVAGSFVIADGVCEGEEMYYFAQDLEQAGVKVHPDRNFPTSRP